MKFKFSGINKKEIMAAALIILAGSILGIMRTVQEEREAETEYLERNPFGEGAYEETLKVKTKQGEQEIKVLVEERQYSEEEIRQYMQMAESALDSWAKRVTDEAGNLTGNVKFPEQLEENPVILSWSTDAPDILNWDGNIGEALKETGEEVKIMCSLSIGEETEIWEKMVCIYPEKINKTERIQRDIRREIEKNNEESSEKLYLPERLYGEKISYRREKINTGLAVWLCSLVLGFGIFPLKKEKEKQQKEKQKREMQNDYPDIIEKLILFLKAGFSIRKSMEKLASDYIRSREKYQLKERHAYEEIVRTCKEMEGGMYEAEAYERMGKRCAVPEYKVLSVLLIQNLRKGNKSILELLEREAVSAEDERHRRAKVIGDETSTKLLLPMILQLIVVLIILIVPAFLSFL